jgi:F-type H+-transporting ATPase subunit gamma
MKLISVVKLKRAKQQLAQTLPFFEKVKATIADILMHSGNIENIFFDVRNEKEAKNKAYIVFAGDKGLAGGYNHNIIKLTEENLCKNPNSRLFVAGHMGRSQLQRKKFNVDEEFDYPVGNPTVFRAREIADKILELFKKGEIDEVYVIYTKMISSIKQEAQIMKLLPLELSALKNDLSIEDTGYHKIDDTLVYEPSIQSVYDVLVPKYVKGIIYGVLVEAFTSEQSARMTAMDSATSNADEMLQRLNLFYNRARQAAITKEISEIVGGAEVLK